MQTKHSSQTAYIMKKIIKTGGVMKRVGLSIGMYLLAFTAILPSLSAGVPAAENSYDLYSWPKPGASIFCYVLVPASNGPVVAADLKASKDVVCGRELLKN